MTGDKPGRLDPNALTPEQMAHVLSQFGEPVPLEWVEKDVAAGCPTNEDGTLNTIVYMAWITRELIRRETGSSPPPTD